MWMWMWMRCVDVSVLGVGKRKGQSCRGGWASHAAAGGRGGGTGGGCEVDRGRRGENQVAEEVGRSSCGLEKAVQAAVAGMDEGRQRGSSEPAAK